MNAIDFVAGKVNGKKFGFSDVGLVKEYKKGLKIESPYVLIKGKSWRRDVDLAYGKAKIIVLAEGDEFNRKVLENKKVNVLLSPEIGRNKVKLKKQESGLNHVLCKIARENNIMICEVLRDLADYRVLARVIQNIRLCKKYNVRFKFVSLADSEGNMRDAESVRSLGIVLGMSTDMAKKGVESN